MYDCSSRSSSSASGAEGVARDPKESSPLAVRPGPLLLVAATSSQGAFIKWVIMIFITCLNYLN